MQRCGFVADGEVCGYPWGGDNDARAAHLITHVADFHVKLERRGLSELEAHRTVNEWAAKLGSPPVVPEFV